MSSWRMQAMISIGGIFPADLVQSLTDRIAAEGVALDWAGDDYRPRDADDLTEASASHTLDLYSNEAPGGMFQELEEFLAENCIAFSRCTEAYADVDAHVVQFRPGLGPITCLATQDGQSLIPVEQLRPVEALLGEAVESGAVGLVREALAMLGRVLGPHVPELEPFRVVDQPTASRRGVSR